MPIATRTFRVFVSSTFEDLKAERDALQRHVFPRLRKLCEENNARFQAIDLRWGVRDEAALDQQTMEICLREIERCQQTGIKPNFIVLLGDRYGWRPLPVRIEAQEFDSVCGCVADAERQLINAWYERDDNAVPPEYLLKPRTAEFADNDRWREIEQKLHRILREAARDAGLTEGKLIKYEVSATHQEILKGLGGSEEDRKHAFAFFREPAPGTTEDPDLGALKQDLRNKLGKENVCPFPASDPAKLCADVEELLSKVILAEAGTFKSRPALDLEIEAHEAFARDRARHFTGRKSVLDAIDAHIRGGESRPLVVHGPSGCGKSAIVAKASAQAKAEMPGAVLIQRFIGVTPDSSNGLTLLHSLCEQFSREYGFTEETPMGFQPLVVAFHERMARATAEQPLVLFLDALDQLRSDDEARAFTWLRQTLPEHVSLVVSTTEIPVGLESTAQVAVEDFPVREAEEVLAAWLQDAHRKLEPEQREKVLSGFAPSGLPLYLKLAFEEARSWASHLPLEGCMLGEGVEGVIDTLLNRLSFEANHGPLLVSRGLGYLAAARYGLAEDEILDVLSADEEVWQDFECRAHHTPPERRLPVIVWSRLFLDLEPYLAERSVPGGTAVNFYHRQLAEQAAARFLSAEDSRRCHASLAAYFAAQPHWFDPGQSRPNARKAAELVHHHLGAGQIDEASTALTDIEFIASKCGAGLVFDLQADYSAALSLLPEARAELEEERRRGERVECWTREIVEYSCAWQSPQKRDRAWHVVRKLFGVPRPRLPEIPASAQLWSDARIAAERQRIQDDPKRLDRVRSFARFIEAECHVLLGFGQRPGFAIQHAINYAPAGPVHRAAHAKAGLVAAPMLLRRWPPEAVYDPQPALVRTLEGLGDAREGMLGVWDLETGVCLRTLEGHHRRVNSVSVTPDGRRAVTGSDDWRVRIWDLQNGACLRELRGHFDGVESVSVTPSGLRAVSAGGHELRLWNLETGECLRTFEDCGHWIRGVSVTPDGRRAISVGGSLDGSHATVRVWDLEMGACLRVLEGKYDCSVSVTPDGRRAVSAGSHMDGNDATVRVWDLETGTCLRALEGHRGWLRRVSMTPDGRYAVSASLPSANPLVVSARAELRVWDLEAGVCVRVLEGPRAEAATLSVTADGRRAVSADNVTSDGRHVVSAGGLRVWDLERGACLRTVKGGGSDSVSLTADARRAVSAGGRGLRVWDLQTGACLRTLEREMIGFHRLSVTPDGRRAVSSSASNVLEKALRVWDLETGECLRSLEERGGYVSVAPDGQRAVSAGGRWQDYTVRVWDLNTGRCLHTLEGHRAAVTSVIVTPDGRRAVSASSDKTLRVWNLETGACLHTLEGHGDAVNSVSVTPDGKRAVSGGGTPQGSYPKGYPDDYSVRIWELETGACLHISEGHRSSVLGVSVTPDGRRAVSRSYDRTLRVWDLDTGACLRTMEGHNEPVNSMKRDARRAAGGVHE